MANVSTDSLGRAYLRGPNGQFARPKTDEERKMIEKARKQNAKENKSRVSGVFRTESAGKKKLSNKREPSKFAVFHGSKLSAKREHSTSKKIATSDSKALTRSKSLSVTNDDSGYGSLRSKSKHRFSIAKRNPSIRSNSASEVSQSLQTKSAIAPRRNAHLAKSSKKSMSEDQSLQTMSVSAPKRNARLTKSDKKSLTENQSFQTTSVSAPRRSTRLAAAKASLSKAPVKRVQSKTVKRLPSSIKRKLSVCSDSVTDEKQNIRSKSNAAPKRNVRFAELSNNRRSSSTKRKPLIRSDSMSEETQSTQSKSIDAPKRNARLAQLEKSRGSKSSAKRGQFEAAKLLSFSDSVSDGESNSPQANLAVVPRRSARLAAKARK